MAHKVTLMLRTNLRVGLRVRTIETLDDARGILVQARHIIARTPNKIGTLTGYVPGHGGEVWWIQHLDGTVGAYAHNEFDAV